MFRLRVSKAGHYLAQVPYVALLLAAAEPSLLS